MVSAEGEKIDALNGVWYGEGCPLSSQVGGSGERRKLFQWGPGRIFGWRPILAYFEGHTMFLFAPICVCQTVFYVTFGRKAEVWC